MFRPEGWAKRRSRSAPQPSRWRCSVPPRGRVGSSHPRPPSRGAQPKRVGAGGRHPPPAV